MKRKKGRTEEKIEEVQDEVQEHLYDVNSSASRPTQEENHFVPTPRLPQQHYEPFDPAINPKSDLDIMPQVIYEISQDWRWG